MKIGICGGLTGKNTDGSSFDFPRAAREAGYDFLEVNLSAVAGLSEEEFGQFRSSLAAVGLPVEACNVMFPATIRLTGPAADLQVTRTYLAQAYERAADLGIKVMVFGSAGARNVPEGFPLEEAWLQLVHMLRMAGDIAASKRLTIVIEPLNQSESNIIQTVSEGFTLAKQVNHPAVRLLADYYHMAKDGEDCGVIRTAGSWIQHTHFADPEGRAYPTVDKPTFRDFFSALKDANYQGRVSLEAGFSDFASEAPAALRIMRALAG